MKKHQLSQPTAYRMVAMLALTSNNINKTLYSVTIAGQLTLMTTCQNRAA
jgi:hypothetical protein